MTYLFSLAIDKTKLGIDTMKKLVKRLKQVKTMKLLITRLSSASWSLENLSQSQATKELWSATGYPEMWSVLDCKDTLFSLTLL